ncbi:hypothetical protein BJF90_45385 [Pseudonocardia sp. CNS-004]|nr:hypothetical protein BJF90_45385 [Pseudonocardia sp. CNS-004]
MATVVGERLEELRARCAPLGFAPLPEIAATTPEGPGWTNAAQLSAPGYSRLDEYTAAVAAVATRHATTIAGATVALLRFTATELRIVRGEIFGASILAHAGIRRPPSTDTPGSSTTYVSLSEETVGVTADADVLLYFTGGGGPALDAGDTAQRYLSGGLWAQLPAVQAGRAVELDPVAWWDGYSVSAALACVAELDAALARIQR